MALIPYMMPLTPDFKNQNKTMNRYSKGRALALFSQNSASFSLRGRRPLARERQGKVLMNECKTVSTCLIDSQSQYAVTEY